MPACGDFGIGFGARSEEIEYFFADIFELEPEVHENLGGDAVVLAEEPEEDVLGADIVVIEVAGFFDRVLDDLFGAWSLRELAHGDHFWASADEFFDFESDLAEVNIEVFEDIGADARSFFDESEQDVLGPDVFMVEALGFLVGQGHYFAGSICESFKHATSPAARFLRTGRLFGVFTPFILSSYLRVQLCSTLSCSHQTGIGIEMI